MTDRAVMQQALEALREFGYHGSSPRWERTANALKTALEQPEPDLIPQDQLFVCGQMGANITRVTAQPEPMVDCPRCGHVCSQHTEQEPVAFYHPRNGFYWAKPTSIFAPTVVDVPPMPLYAAAERNNG